MERIKYSDITEGHEFDSYCDYAIEFDDESSIENIEQSLGSYFRRLGTRVGIINYRNYIGISRFGNKLVIVKSNKISEKDYEQMIKDIISKMSELPFDFNSPTNEFFMINEEIGSDILYHMYLILKYIVIDAEPNLNEALTCIFRDPTKKDVREINRREIWNIDNITNHVITSIASNPEILRTISSGSVLNRTEIAKQLRMQTGNTYFPMYADTLVHNKSFDTFENRFIKHFINFSKEIIDKFRDSIDAKGNIINRIEIINVCNLISEILEDWSHHELFKEIGEMKRVPFDSIILQKREGYKDVFHFFNLLNSSIYIPFDEKKLKLIIENKDIAQLYEIWSYFKILELIEECVDIKSSEAELFNADDYKVYMVNGIKVTFNIRDKTIKAWYNKTYSRGKGSYSLTLRPDIVLEINDSKYIFDAKFKLDKVNWEDSVDNEREEEHSFTFKKGDVYKMHTYKDAIEDVKIACILYPNPLSDAIEFFNGHMATVGVGAIPFTPSSDYSHVIKFLKEKIFRIENVKL